VRLVGVRVHIEGTALRITPCLISPESLHLAAHNPARRLSLFLRSRARLEERSQITTNALATNQAFAPKSRATNRNKASLNPHLTIPEKALRSMSPPRYLVDASYTWLQHLYLRPVGETKLLNESFHSRKGCQGGGRAVWLCLRSDCGLRRRRSR